MLALGRALCFADVLLGHKRRDKSCLLVYIPWESAAALGFRLVPSQAAMCCVSPGRQLVCGAAAHLRGRTCRAFTERVPRIAREEPEGRSQRGREAECKQAGRKGELNWGMTQGAGRG